MITREQIYKAELEEIGNFRQPHDGCICVECDYRGRARAALEAAAKVGDDAFVCNAVCCDDSHPDHAQELRRLLAEAEDPRPAIVSAFPCPKCGGGKPGTPGKDSLCDGCWNAEYQRLCEEMP